MTWPIVISDVAESCMTTVEHMTSVHMKSTKFYFLSQFEFEFEWGFYTLSASKAIFRARTYNCITYSVR